MIARARTCRSGLNCMVCSVKLTKELVFSAVRCPLDHRGGLDELSMVRGGARRYATIHAVSEHSASTQCSSEDEASQWFIGEYPDSMVHVPCDPRDRRFTSARVPLSSELLCGAVVRLVEVVKSSGATGRQDTLERPTVCAGPGVGCCRSREAFTRPAVSTPVAPSGSGCSCVFLVTRYSWRRISERLSAYPSL